MDNDHRSLGRRLGIFDTHELVGAGLPLWLPAGAAIRAELERFAAEEAVRGGCQGVYTPVLAKRELYERSGHWAKFAADMFPPMLVGGEEYVLRPANCPHHALIYASRQRSYKDLPVRLAELGAMFRGELSGVLGGLSRVRQINLDDAHGFCRPDQMEAEIAAAVRQLRDAYRVLGVEVDHFRLSQRDGSPKYLGDAELWARAEKILAEVLDGLGVPWVAAPGEAAFYGPKIDIQVRDARGREETLSTVQLDFVQPERFELEYVAADGRPRRPVMIHRGLLSAMERLVAYLLERYEGALPPWLSPVQAVVLPVAADHAGAARDLLARLAAAGVRAELDDGDNTLALRVRRAQERKVPYLLVLGDAELAAGTVAMRLRDGRRAALPRPAAIDGIVEQVRERATGLGF